MAANNDKAIRRISQAERYARVRFQAINLRGNWLSEAGFREGVPVKIRVMPDCIMITPQNTRELWNCLEGLSVEPFNAKATASWINQFPGGLMYIE